MTFRQTPVEIPHPVCELSRTGVDDPLTGCTKCGAKPDYTKPDYAAVLDYEYKCQEGRKP